MSKNVAVFVDVANIFYAAKAAGVDIDYVTLLKSATAGRDFIRAYAYTGLDPENENQRQFQSFLARNGFKVVSKDIRKYGDGKVKANLDIELVVDMMKTARNVDIAVIVSGDGDFAPAIRAVQEMGVRVEVISFRGNTSSDLIEAADQFTDITQLAKVERSTRSGRRVAASETDLSMTAVPDKETEGAPRRRRRTTKAEVSEPAAEGVAEPPAAAAAVAGGRGGREGGRRGAAVPAAAERPVPALAARSAAEAIAAAGMPALRVLPGERLSRVAPTPSAAGPGAGEEQGTTQAPPAAPAPGDDAVESEAGSEPMGEGALAQGPRDGEGRRRRRRRGGRGRGRGRGRERETPIGAEPGGGEPGGAEPGSAMEEGAFESDTAAEAALPYAPLRPPQSAFGSIWDSQLGMTAPSRPPSAEMGPPNEEEDIEEPEIPEYLLAERGRSSARGPRGGRGRGPRGGPRGAYAAALDRERFGRSGAPSRTWSPERGPRPGRQPGQFQGPARPMSHARPASAEPWSEVPPDLEEEIRARLAATRPSTPETAGMTPEPSGSAGQPAAAAPAPDAPETAGLSVSEAVPERAAVSRRRPTAARSTSTTGRATGRGRTGTRVASDAPADVATVTPAADTATGTSPAPRGRGSRRAAVAKGNASSDAAEAASSEDAATEAPKRRARTRKTAAS